MAEQQKRYVETYVESMQRHIHMHKNLHSAMLRTWQKMDIAHGKGRQSTSRIPNTTPPTRHLVQH